MLDHVAGAIRGRDIRAAAHIELRHVDLVFREDVDQKHHPLPRVGGVFAVGVTLEQIREVVECLFRRCRVALADVGCCEAIEQSTVFVELGESLYVVGVVDVRVLRMQPDETVSGTACGLRLIRHEVRVDQFELRLLGIAAERKAGLELLQLRDRVAIVGGTQARLSAAIQHLLGRFLVFVFFFVMTSERPQRTPAEQAEQSGQNNDACHLFGAER